MNILTLKNVTYSTGNIQILKNISLEIKKGDCISIIGESGSGKSTLLKLCSDLLSPTSGEFYFYKNNYTSYNPIELRRNISYCVQIPQLFGKTVYDNLKFPYEIRKEEMNMERVKELLDRFNFQESFLHKEINGLSGGEKQRISIIRNLLYKPEVLLLDEATSALDEKNTMIFEKYVKELNSHGVTVLWITHNIRQSKGIFNKRIIIDSGEIKELEVY